MVSKYITSVLNHYQKQWGAEGSLFSWCRGPMVRLCPSFSVARFRQNAPDLWTYATVCLAEREHCDSFEIHIHCREQDDSIAELLTMVAHYHMTGQRLDLFHSVNFGRPWHEASLCDHGILSLPYLDGPSLGNGFEVEGGRIHFYWLVPVTCGEIKFRSTHGHSRLEDLFESSNADVFDPYRSSVV